MQTNLNHINLSTGPVSMHPEVVKAFKAVPEAHRSDSFMDCYHELVSNLKQLTKARYAFVLSGSGSLGNEVITTYIKSEKTKGLVLSNGEFGERLIAQCSVQQVPFVAHRIPWGVEFDLAVIEAMILEQGLRWIYFVHCESSTGCINDYQGIVHLCKKHHVKVYTDVMSSIGNCHVDLSEVQMASASSGKGLGSFPGLSIVFANEIPMSSDAIPTYFDLHFYQKKQGVPFTISTNLVRALHTSLKVTDFSVHIQHLSTFANELLLLLKQVPDMDLLNLNYTNPSHILTCRPHSGIASSYGFRLLDKGIHTSFSSGYHKQNNLLQLAVMGHHQLNELEYINQVLLDLVSQMGEVNRLP